MVSFQGERGENCKFHTHKGTVLQITIGVHQSAGVVALRRKAVICNLEFGLLLLHDKCWCNGTGTCGNIEEGAGGKARQKAVHTVAIKQVGVKVYQPF